MSNQKLVRLNRILAAAALWLGAPIAFGQFETAAVLGTVLDPNGAVVREARVTLVSQETGVAQQATTDDQGNYQFLEVRLGEYEVRVEASGFKKATTPQFRVTVGARQRVNATLEVGEVTQSVEVNASAAIVEQESSERDQVVSQEDISNLPLNGRDSTALALLAPGVRNSYTLSKREASFNVNGLRSQFNNFTLDGVDNNAYGTSNQGLSNQVVQLSPDTLQEFSVVTNTYSAEYGHVGGAVINATIRSGTNQLHGAAWEYFRNTDLNATGFFKPLDNEKPVYIQNQFGAAVGGPIKKDKAFIFVDYERLRLAQDTLTFASLPTVAERNDVFSIPVQNAYTNALFPNNTIPATDISSFAAKVASEIPVPNLSGNTNNYSLHLPSGDASNKGDIRYDHYFSSKVTYFARYSYRLDNSTTAPGSAIEAPAGGCDISRVMNWQGMMATTWTISPTSILEVRMSS
jgi:Carboxypeptidase regulatory-like domain/TonB-dependent Receptor Plug Domain